MLQRLWRALEEKGWPQKIVACLGRRATGRFDRYFAPRGAATHAVSLSVASPTLATKDLFEAVVPSTLGAWRDCRLLDALLSNDIVVTVLRELRMQTEFALVLPRHADFNWKEFARQKVLRLTCEAERAALLTVRRPDGKLLACGTLELVPRAAFSRQVRL